MKRQRGLLASTAWGSQQELKYVCQVVWEFVGFSVPTTFQTALLRGLRRQSWTVLYSMDWLEQMSGCLEVIKWFLSHQFS